MDFDVNLNTIFTGVSTIGVVGAFKMLLGHNTRIAVIESHNVGTEQMRMIMREMLEPQGTEIHELRDQICELQKQLANRRASD